MMDIGGQLRFTQWQKGLAQTKPTPAVKTNQQEFVRAVRDGADSFSAYLRSALGPPSGAVPRLQVRPLSAAEAFGPPIEIEAEFGDRWLDLASPALASQPYFWTLTYQRWIEEGVFADPLEACLATGKPGVRKSERNDLVRTCLRNMGGLPHVRGNVSAFSDCPMARAYWRRRWAREAAAVPEADLSVDAAHQALRQSKGEWEALVLVCLHRVTVLNTPRVRAAIIADIAQRTGSRTGLVNSIARTVAPYGLHRSFEHMPWEELRGLVARAKPDEAKVAKTA